ncbi:WG repeat-containing protein [uncultured Xanthomonas sp.]|uniref:WG repeat-containing protein n=1 Tax=uncultured Xanthomonas sp. TaxID=152831 RepID=UPI0025D92351|nr:WG repeat-containing protein [uncultured Xanthomonas sp.]
MNRLLPRPWRRGRLRAAAALLALATTAAAVQAQAQPDDACRLGDPTTDRDVVPGCRLGADERLLLTPQALRRLPFDRDGLALLTVGARFYYVRADGRSLPVITWDNGPDGFTEGLTRGIFHGRIGFYDRQLREVIAPVHDFAWPFEHGVAAVCDGCSAGTPDTDGHTPMQGGRWYSIDRHNREVPAPKH